MTEFARPITERNLTRRGVLLGFGAGVVSIAAGCGERNEPAPIEDCGDTTPTAERRELNSDPNSLVGYNWHIPGVERSGNTLSVQPTNLESVPMNMYGARLDTNGDYAIGADATLGTGGEFALHLKDGVALSYDGYVQSPAGVRVTVTTTGGRYEVWRNEHDAPLRRDFGLQDTSPDKQIVIVHNGERMVLTVNGQQVGEWENTLDAGALWLGLRSRQSATKINELTARELPGGTVSITDTSSIEYPQCADGLDAKVQAKTGGRLQVGTAMRLGPFVQDERFGSLAIGEFGVHTTENAGKFRFLQPERGVYTFGELDSLVDIAARHKKDVWLHTMVWHRELPDWVMRAAPQEREQIMTDHITTVMRHTRGRVKGVDVVNEPLEEYNGNLRRSPWLDAMGADYIAKALRAAHQADPDAELWINEYGWDKDTPKDEERFQKLLAIAQNLKDRGIRLDGIGLQGHVLVSPRDSANIAVLKRRMDAFAALGKNVRISEIDITENAGKASQAKQYGDMLRLAIAQPNCTGYVMWGIGGPYVSTVDVRKPNIEMRTPWDEHLRPTQIYSELQAVAA